MWIWRWKIIWPQQASTKALRWKGTLYAWAIAGDWYSLWLSGERWGVLRCLGFTGRCWEKVGEHHDWVKFLKDHWLWWDQNQKPGTELYLLAFYCGRNVSPKHNDLHIPYLFISLFLCFGKKRAGLRLAVLLIWAKPGWTWLGSCICCQLGAGCSRRAEMGWLISVPCGLSSSSRLVWVSQMVGVVGILRARMEAPEMSFAWNSYTWNSHNVASTAKCQGQPRIIKN